MLKTLVKIEETLAMLLLAAIVIFVFTAAIMRTAGYPVIWSVDMAQLLFIWVCMLGANMALRRNEHIGVDFLVRRFSTTNRNRINLLLYLLIAAFLILLVLFGIQLTLVNPERTLGTINLPYSLVTAAVPAGAVLMLVTVTGKITALVQAIKTGGKSGATTVD